MLNFNKEQLEAINFFNGNCCVIACAGSGKTAVLTNRIKNLIDRYHVNPTEILAITYNKGAKDVLKDRMSELCSADISKKIAIETFHSFGYKIIKKTNNPFKNFDMFSEKDASIVINSLGLGYKLYYNKSDIPTNDVFSYISFKKNNMEIPSLEEDPKACQELLMKQQRLLANKSLSELELEEIDEEINASKFSKLYFYYEIYKDEHSLIDFDDMLYKLPVIFDENPNILNAIQSKYKYILIDEVQDINKIQYEIIKKLANKNSNVFIVGDPFQNIYNWRGTSNNFMSDFINDYDAKVINLYINYRSTLPIVKYSNNLISDLPEAKATYYIPSQAYNKDGDDPIYIGFETQLNEAEDITSFIANKVRISDYTFSDFTILARTNAQLHVFARYCYKNEIPFSNIGFETFFQTLEISSIVNYIKLATNHNDDEAFEFIYNIPSRYLGEKFLYSVKQFAKENSLSLYDAMFKFPNSGHKSYAPGIAKFSSIISTITQLQNSPSFLVSDIVKYFRDNVGLLKYCASVCNKDRESGEITDNIKYLIKITDKYNNCADFIEYANNELAFSVKKSSSAIKLMTIHKSKGMEFPVVFIAGLTNNILPHRKTKNLDEEQRLLYVAMTRAEKELYLSSFNIDSIKEDNSQPSLFLNKIFNN